jgi:hypothetical protein
MLQKMFSISSFSLSLFKNLPIKIINTSILNKLNMGTFPEFTTLLKHEQTQNKYKVNDLTHATASYKLTEVMMICNHKLPQEGGSYKDTCSHDSMQPIIPIGRAWHYN